MRADLVPRAGEASLRGAAPFAYQLPSRAMVAHCDRRGGHLGRCSRVESGACDLSGTGHQGCHGAFLLVCVSARKMAAPRYGRISTTRNCVTFVTGLGTPSTCRRWNSEREHAKSWGMVRRPLTEPDHRWRAE